MGKDRPGFHGKLSLAPGAFECPSIAIPVNFLMLAMRAMWP